MPEFEIKFALAAHQLPVARRALTALGARRPETRLLVSTYYDTPGRALLQRKLSLRVRRSDNHLIQTLKSTGDAAGGLFERQEWSTEIAGEEPEIGELPKRNGLRRALAAERLQPIFTTSVRRTAFTVRAPKGTAIEVALDDGTLSTALERVKVPIGELEIELKRGDPRAVYDFALALLRRLPLRMEPMSKFERGLALLDSARATPVVHVNALPLKPGQTVEEMLQAIGRTCLSAFLRNQPAALASSDAGIHQMRVATRKLRSALSALKPMLPAEDYGQITGELKRLGNALGPARNWDVLLATLRGIAGEEDASELGAALRAAGAARQAAHRQARQAILQPASTEAVLRVSRWIETRGWRDHAAGRSTADLRAPLRKAARKLLTRRCRQARRRSRNFRLLSAPQRHRLRIALKKLRYVAEFLQPLFPERDADRFLKRLKPLQEDLGRLNDLRTAHALFAELTPRKVAVARGAGLALGWWDHDAEAVEAAGRRHARRFRHTSTFW